MAKHGAAPDGNSAAGELGRYKAASCQWVVYVRCRPPWPDYLSTSTRSCTPAYRQCRISAAICTNNLNKALDFTDQVNAGMVHGYAPTLHDEPHVPFGGTSDRGFAREGVEVDVDALTEWKVITIQLPAADAGH